MSKAAPGRRPGDDGGGRAIAPRHARQQRDPHGVSFSTDEEEMTNPE